MNYKKIILVGFISAFVAVLTSIMGVAGTIIGSVVSSVLYNMLTEALENPVDKAKFGTSIEWEIAYVFPIAVITLIQLLLIFALLAEMGLFPSTFLNVYLSLQNLADNNLYRLLGVALLIISAYPLVLKPDFVKKEHGMILVFVAIIFLARGFVDLGIGITKLYDDIFMLFDLPIAILACILLMYVIARILMSANESKVERKVSHASNRKNVHGVHSKRHDDFDYAVKRPIRNFKKGSHDKIKESQVNFSNRMHKQDAADDEVMVDNGPKINRSSDKIHFESNDLLDDYKK